MEIEEFVEQVLAWHTNRVAQLRQITENKDAVIQIGDVEIEPDSDAAKGFRAGVAVSLELLGKLPFSVSCNENESDEDEDS